MAFKKPKNRAGDQAMTPLTNFSKAAIGRVGDVLPEETVYKIADLPRDADGALLDIVLLGGFEFKNGRYGQMCICSVLLPKSDNPEEFESEPKKLLVGGVVVLQKFRNLQEGAAAGQIELPLLVNFFVNGENEENEYWDIR